MSKDLSGEAFDRLRAADPAAGLEPDHDALRKAVAARADVVDELAARRRRPRALQVAAASAGALAIGVGGFALGGGFAPSLVAGAESGSGSDSAASAAPAITLDGAADSPSAAMPEMATEGPAMGGGEAGRTGASSYVAQDMAYMPSFGRTVFSASGLSTSETTAPAYGYDGAAAHSAEALERLAGALGASGKVREDYGSLILGDYESGEPVATLYGDGTASFYFSDPSKDPWFCPPDRECEERDLGAAPQGEDALDEATDVLLALGLDPADFELEVSDKSDYGSTDYSSVNAFRVLDGQRTGDSWGVTFTGAGVSSVWGPTAELVELGEYDVISPAEAVERLNDPRFGASFSSFPADWVGPATLMREGSTSAPRTPSAGDRFDWPVESVKITSERLGLAQHHLGDGGVALVPTYELSSADGRTWSVIAVTEAHLAFD